MTHFLDAHTHLADPRLADTLPGVLARSRAAGITAWIQGGVGPDDWDRQLRLADEHKGIHPCFGLHPWWVAARTDAEIDRALELLESRMGQSVGLGELGLDFGKRGGDDEARKRQERAFHAQLGLAAKTKKPLVLHGVHSHEEILAVLEEIGIPSSGGMVHSFSGNASAADRYIDLGLSISISGGVARKGFETLKRAVIRLPPERLLLETDSPDQGAVPGELNEPASLLKTAEAVGILRGEDPRELLRRSTENARKIFSL